jgi:CHAD domain-containing protein
MAYKLERGEGLASGIRRIVTEELDGAIAQLEGRGDPDGDTAVHEARKSLKKARSALRLVREDIGDGVRRRENDAMRDAARRLSGVRDAQVQLETLAKLAGDPQASVPAEAVTRLRRLLEAQREKLRADADGDRAAAEVARELREVRARVDDWPLSDETFAAAGEGLRRIQRQGREAMRTAFERGDDESWHEWRKKVKDLWYAARILRPVAPRQLAGLENESDELSDVLGDHNDLAVLAETVRAHESELAPGHAALLQAALVRRRDRLRMSALPLGRRLYAERPRAFIRRLTACWDAREAQDAADAFWMPPEIAGRVRTLLEQKAQADAAERRRVSAQLRDLGFRVSDFDDHVSTGRGGFSAEDFDTLVARGIVRVGTPSLAGGASGDGKPAVPARPKPPAPSAPGLAPRNGGPTVGGLVMGSVQAAAGLARWARRRLPV